jgi:hypothetical protein
MHASPTTVEEAPPVEATDEQLVATYGGLEARLVVYGHLHRPFVRRIGSLTVANSGSVGWPVDGDWRPSYLLIDEGRCGFGGCGMTWRRRSPSSGPRRIHRGAG